MSLRGSVRIVHNHPKNERTVSNMAKAIGDSLEDIRQLWNVSINAEEYSARFNQFRLLGYF